jgi:hypothetical protein
MCEYCFEQRDIKRRSGTYCKTCGGYLVEIDENFIQSIILLNTKGYYTNYCCSGHPKNKDVHSSYISFYDGLTLPYLPIEYKYDKDLYPQVDFSDHTGHGFCIRYEFKNKENLVELQKEILSSAINVLEWAESLPDIGGIL